MSDDSGKFAEKIGVYVAPGGQAFIETQNIGGQKQLRPFQAPPLPTYYVDRPEYSQDIKTRLLTESNDVRTLVVTAIHGLGSVGKSTIAAALAHDQEVYAHFCDGILWATLGQQPNLLSLLSGWVQALGDYNFKATSVEATSNQLRTLLYDKAVLLVVDDAWNTGDAQAFNVGGARCQVLVTTREAVIADVLGASTYPLDVMKPFQAMELLTKKLRREITGAERQSALDLAKAVGYLPLALELVAAEVASGTTWTELLEDFQQEVARLKTLDRPEAEEITDEVILKRFSLTASLNLSVKRMPKKKQEHFSWLGVLPEDVTITKMMAATLWEMDVRDTAKTLQYLQNKALLLSGVPLPDGTPTYRLHDLFHDLARNLLTAPLNPENEGDLPGLGITLADAHATFLEKYRNLTDKNLWHTLPNDGYIHQHIVWHLEKAKKVEEIHSLLREESKTGGNGWYEACDRLGQTANFVTDVARAWKLAEDSWTETTPSEVIGLQCRYALIITSLNSLSANLPVELLITLVKKNVWTPEQGLTYALQSSNPSEKAYLLIQLVNHVPANSKDTILSKALAATREIQDEKNRAIALSNLAYKLPEILPEALAAAREIQDEMERASALISLADKLPEILPEALAATRKIQNEKKRSYALSDLADKLPEILPEALAIVREFQDEHYRAIAIKDFADKLPPELLPDALDTIRKIQNDYARAYALSNLAYKLPEFLPEALAAAREIQSEFYRTITLQDLADKLPSEFLPEALAAAREIQDEKNRAIALTKLTDKLPEILPEALAAAREIQDEKNRVGILIKLTDKLPEILPEALAAAREIQDEKNRVGILIKLTDKLPEILPEALAAAREIQDERERAIALTRLTDKLPEILPEALAAAKEIQSKELRNQVLISLVDKFPPELLLESLAITRKIQDEEYRASTIISLEVKLQPKFFSEALTVAREIEYELEFRRDIVIMAKTKPPESLPEAMAADKEIRERGYQILFLSILANKMPEILPKALNAAREIQDWEYRTLALINLVDKLPELLPEALDAAKEIQDEVSRMPALISLVPKLSPELLPEALAIAREIQYERNRADILTRLTDKLPELLPEALATAREIQDERNRADILIRLTDKLPELLPEALATTREIQDEKNRAIALIKLTDKLPEVLPEALAAAREIQNERERAIVLISLADKLPELLPEALAAAREIQDEKNRADILTKLTDKLPEILPEALAAAREFQDKNNRVDLTGMLLPDFIVDSESRSKEDYVNILISLADKLPELLLEAWAVASDIPLEKRRAKALRTAADKLSQIQKTQLFSLWRDILYVSSLYTRRYLLSDIEALTPVIFTLGGQQAVKNTTDAIQDVSRWWR